MIEAIELLVVEDSPSDAKLMLKMLEVSKIHNNVHLVRDGAQALQFLHQEGPYADAPSPDLILLDLNLPKRSGHEVLQAIKADPYLKRIPVVIMTSSEDEQDILKSYEHYASSYVTKPVDFEQFKEVVLTLNQFWFSVVKLPPKED